MSAFNTSSVGGAGGLLGSSSGDSTLAALGTDEFLEIVLAEMVNQDPLEPADTSATIDQLAQLWSIESDTALSDSVEAMALQNELNTAAGVIGRGVAGINVDGEPTQGVVISAISTQDGAFLRLDTGDFMAMSSVDEIVAVEPIDDDPGDGSDGGDDTTDDNNNDDDSEGEAG